jgi:urate oxidase
MVNTEPRYTISYGKAQVPLFRVYARPLANVTPIPESAFAGRPNILIAAEIDVEVFGDNFLPAYTQGDNREVVATDSMKNFILQQALAFDGATLEGFLDLLGRRFLATYPQMQALRLTGREVPFVPATVPQDGAANFGPSDVLFRRSHDDYALAVLEFARADGAPTLTAHRCGRVGLQLLKVTGSAFTHFVRDAYTTLPERGDRPLFIYLDIFWKYADPADLLGPDAARYVAAEQVRDLAQAVFHEFVSESIQHLVNEMGQRLLARFPQLAEVTFEGQNHTPDPMAVSDADPRVKVYSIPFPAYGLIKLTLTRK